MNDTAASPDPRGAPATIGARTAASRKALGLTQQDLADRVGVTFQAVSKWETDASLPDVALLAPIASALGLTLDALITGAGYGAERPPVPRASWGKIIGTVTEDIHGDVGAIVGSVQADIHGNVRGSITGDVRNVFGNVDGNILGEVHGDVTGYVAGNVLGTVEGRVRLGVRGKILGAIVGDGINAEGYRTTKGAQRAKRTKDRESARAGHVGL